MPEPPTSATSATQLQELLGNALPGALPSSIERLVRQAHWTQVRAGRLLLKQEELIPFSAIVEGLVAFRRTTADGRQFIFEIARSGSLYGYSGISGQTASSDVVAVTPTTAAVWPGAEVRQLLLADAHLAVSITDAMSRDMSRVSRRVDRFMHQEARGRVVRALTENGDLFFGDRPVLSRALLPAVVGTTREMTNRVMRALEQEGVVERVGRRGLLLLDPAALAGPPREARGVS
jgi:CRP-like cAMP-binding protein